MNNKGTQALFDSDVNIVCGLSDADVSATVSTPDIEGVRKLNLPLDKILPPMVDIPYDKADQMINNVSGARTDLRYKWYFFAVLLFMFVQISLALFSVLLFKLGLKPIYRGDVVRCVAECDLVVSHSDENFKETASLLPLNPIWVVTWWSMLLSRTFEIVVAKSLGKPVVLFPNSIGPFRTWFGRLLAKLSLSNCDRLLIREAVSYDIVKNLKISTPRVLTYDTALLYTPRNEIDVPVSGNVQVGVCPGIYSRSLSKKESENYVVAHAKALDKAIADFGCSVVFIPHYISGFPNDDLDVSRMIHEKMENKDEAKIVVVDGVNDFKNYLNNMDIVISSKMHPAILAATGFVPVLCVVYDHKQSSFFERLNMVDCILGIREVSYETLWSRIDYVFNYSKDLKKSLETIIPIWQKNVQDAIQNTVKQYVK